MPNSLEDVIGRCMAALGVDRPTAAKLALKIDSFKMRGLTGGEGSSRFADYLGFLRIPDSEVTNEFFAYCWTSPLVWTPICPELRPFLNRETPLFTQSRLEPVFHSTPFYEQGLTKVKTGVNFNPEDGSAVRKPKGLTEDYSNFIINEFLPKTFFIEVKNDEVSQVLAEGIRATNEGDDSDEDDEHTLYLKSDDARANLASDLRTHNRLVTREALLQYTLIEIETSKMQINNKVFYTKTVSGHKGQGSNYGYFYSGSVPPSGCHVSSENLTA